MSITKKKKRCMFFILLFITVLSVPVLAEYAAIYWHDAGGTACSAIELGAVPTQSTLPPLYGYYSNSAPVNDPGCCDVQGWVQVEFYTTYGHAIKINAYDINWDTDSIDCTCHRKTWLPGKFFESNQPSCCGDDGSEFYITQGLGMACCNQGGANVCVSSEGRCRSEYGKEKTCHDGIDNDCDNSPDCTDNDCKTGTEIGNCADKIDNDCDGFTDCSDTDCSSTDLDCINCPSEDSATKCADTLDNDCDNQIDCVQGNADGTCVNAGLCPGCESENTAEKCGDSIDNDCDGKKDCVDTDCLGINPPCSGDCVAENSASNNCDDTKDNDCDGFVDHMDSDCPGCPKETKLCVDKNPADGNTNGTCKKVCDPAEPQGCINQNGACEEGEGCACEDCLGKRDSCFTELICDTVTKLCSCPPGTVFCPDGRCRTKCFICGDNITEGGEECDSGTTECRNFNCTSGTATCTTNCTWDTKNSCSGCQQCNPGSVDGYCCVIPNDSKCDRECTANADPDCANLNNGEGCTSYVYDCCKDSKDGKCDPDCISYKDPDCGDSCSNKKDGCCNSANDVVCDPDCDNLPNKDIFVDPDCKNVPCTNGEDGCCINDNDNPDICDPDCILGVDPDCKCGNGIIDAGETCDGINLNKKTCADFFTGYSGVLSCFNVYGKNPCHYDTSGCFNITDVCTGGFCSFGKDCRCPECVGEQSSCGYGAVCDIAARCACIDETTLCKDGTCRTPQTCETYGTGEQKCITQNNVCDADEGCGCQDCEGRIGPCNSLSVCNNGICTSGFMKNVYWSSVETGKAEDCIGSGREIKLTAKGSSGYEGKTITFDLKEQDGGIIESALAPDDDVASMQGVFKNGKAELTWVTKFFEKGEKSEKGDEPNDCVLGICDAKKYGGNPPTNFLEYYFIANIGKEKFQSDILKVHYCIPECDADCDTFIDSSLRRTVGCIARIGSVTDPDVLSGPEADYPYKERKITLDANPKSGYCEDCHEDGLSSGQETCAAYYDCTPGWWESSPPTGWKDKTKQDAMKYLEWSNCGDEEGKEANGTGRIRVKGSERVRRICPPGLSINNCCAAGHQEDCYCELPGPEAKGMDCDNPDLRPTEIKACLAEEKFPFFTNLNILIVVLMLIAFYICKTRPKPVKKRILRTKK